MGDKKKGPSFGSWVKYWYKITWKGRISRIRVRWKIFSRKQFSPKKPEINSMQVRAIELFMTLLKHKSSSLNHSPQSSARFLKSDFIWITMSASEDHNNYLINVIDESNVDHAYSHEVLIPKEYAYEIIDEFDIELERRFRQMEIIKKRVVIDDFIKLIEQVKAK